MQLSAANAVDYLQRRGHLLPNDRAVARELSGGVSNVVVHVSKPDGDALVLKQARERLNVADPWFCSVERVWREIAVLRQCERLVGGRQSTKAFQVEVPRFLFDDRAMYLYAMSAAPLDHVVWKDELLRGDARPEVAAACGTLLGLIHGGTWHNTDVARRFDDRQYFDDLRLDPYYRQIARVHPDLAAPVQQLIDSVRAERHCLVHGDFSPKNLLLHGKQLILIDFEVGHYGDPAFDLGFFLAHLMLKAFYHVPRHEDFFALTDSFWNGYRSEMAAVVPPPEFDALVCRGILNFAGCALARLDGKSKIDYLKDSARRDAVRALCRSIFAEQPAHWDDVNQLARRQVAASRN
jgi:5-methylthioribose kinase